MLEEEEKWMTDGRVGIAELGIWSRMEWHGTNTTALGEKDGQV